MNKRFGIMNNVCECLIYQHNVGMKCAKYLFNMGMFLTKGVLQNGSKWFKGMHNISPDVTDMV